MNKPSIGRIVHYCLDEADRSQIAATGGNHGLIVQPAVIVAVHSDDCVNLKVLIDGPQDLWVTSIMHFDPATGDDAAQPANGTWRWPPRV